MPGSGTFLTLPCAASMLETAFMQTSPVGNRLSRLSQRPKIATSSTSGAVPIRFHPSGTATTMTHWSGLLNFSISGGK